MHFNSLTIPTILCSAALFLTGVNLERKAGSPANRLALTVAGFALAAPGLLFDLYYFHLFDRAAWFYNFRAVRFSELATCGRGLAAGALHSWLRSTSLGGKVAVPATLFVLVFIPFAKPILVPLDFDRLQDRWSSEVCLQSTPSTCGPASAATVFRALGKTASEKQLATECFTYSGGTEIWYIARAFRRRGFSAQIFTQSTDSVSFPSPAIAGVVLGGGAGHFIAILGDAPTQVTLGDPLKGRLIVNKAELQHIYHFTGLFLVIHPNPDRR